MVVATLARRDQTCNWNSLWKARSRRKSTMPIFSKDVMIMPIDKASMIGTSRSSEKKLATGTANPRIRAAVSRPRRTDRVKAVSYIARSGLRSRISASATPTEESASAAAMKPVARAIRPKSVGSSSRTRISVLSSPIFRVASRHAMTHPAPLAVRLAIDPRPLSSVLIGQSRRSVVGNEQGQEPCGSWPCDR